MTFHYALSDGFTLKGKTLVIPVVSTGNVAQLAADMLISSLDLRQTGIFDSRDHVPVAGSREDGLGICTPLELYGKQDVDIVIMLQRSPVLRSHKAAFTAKIHKFAEENNFGALLFLSGVSPSGRVDSQMQTPLYSLIPQDSPPLDKSPISLVQQLPPYKYAVSSSPTMSPEELAGQIPFIPQGGLTRRLLTLPHTAEGHPWRIPAAALLLYVLEGDNRQDATLLASATARMLKLSDVHWKTPQSWNVAFYGCPHDQALYG